ncbi:hypothetical protein FACS1894151_01750 [Spirochaetia bacterium]|nr:hypothetical protein FACS1894151_01750 [Spirochaetia bacterium]
MRKITLSLMVCLLLPGFLSAQSTITLDSAISQAASDFGNTTPSRSKVLVLHIQSPTDALQDYIIKQLTTALARNPSFSVVQERNRPSLQAYNLRLDEELSDVRARTIGSELGMNVVITGAVIVSGNATSLRFRTVSVQNGQVLLTRNYSLRQEAALTGLLRTQ